MRQSGRFSRRRRAALTPVTPLPRMATCMVPPARDPWSALLRRGRGLRNESPAFTGLDAHGGQEPLALGRPVELGEEPALAELVAIVQHAIGVGQDLRVSAPLPLAAPGLPASRLVG